MPTDPTPSEVLAWLRNVVLADLQEHDPDGETSAMARFAIECVERDGECRELSRRMVDVIEKVEEKAERDGNAVSVGPEWRCPICDKRVTYGQHCEHVYFDEQIYVGPLVKDEYQETDDADAS